MSGSFRIAYIGHPLGAGPDREHNRANASHWVGWIARHLKVAPVADWIILSGEWDETAENREAGLAIDLALVARCDFVILCGGRISPGMALEAEQARKLGKPVVDLTFLGFEPPHTPDGVPDELLKTWTEVAL